MLCLEKPTQTVDGYKARILCKNLRSLDKDKLITYQYVWAITNPATNIESIIFTDENGINLVNDCNIINTPVETVKFYPIKRNGEIKGVGCNSAFEASASIFFEGGFKPDKLLSITFINDVPVKVDLVKNIW